MIPSRSCVDFIKQWEGFRAKAYLDVAGIPTIGFGTIQYPDGRKVKLGEIVTKGDAYECLEHEVKLKSSAVVEATKGLDLSQNQFDALVSFAYNVGSGALRSSTLLKKVKANPNDPSIRAEFLKWNKARVKGKLVAVDGLTNRRLSEANLYFKK